MSFYDTRIRIRHPCPFCNLSAAFPEARITHWCNQANDVLHLEVADPEELEEILKYAKKSIGAADMLSDGHSALTITRQCSWTSFPSVTAVANRWGVWLLPPITYIGGWESHRVISPSKRTLDGFVAGVRKLGSVELLSHRPRDRLDVIRDIGVVPIHFFEGLTDRQIHTLVSAYETGILDVPARTTMGRAAERDGLARSTFGEHLRKAQLQLLRNSYPYLKLQEIRESATPHPRWGDRASEMAVPADRHRRKPIPVTRHA